MMATTERTLIEEHDQGLRSSLGARSGPAFAAPHKTTVSIPEPIDVLFVEAPAWIFDRSIEPADSDSAEKPA